MDDGVVNKVDDSRTVDFTDCFHSVTLSLECPRTVGLGRNHLRTCARETLTSGLYSSP